MVQDSLDTVGDEVIKTKMDYSSPFFEAYTQLTNETFILKELNSELPQSIKEGKRKREKDIREKMASLDQKTRARVKTDINELVAFVDKSLKSTRSKKTPRSPTLAVKGRSADIFWDLACSVMLPLHFDKFIRDMSLVYLVAEFESFLRNVLEISFGKKPEILSSSRKTIRYEEIVKFKKIGDVKEQIIEREILSIINKDVENINEYFEEKFNVQLSLFPSWKEFKERFYRRNIIVHNSGMTNKLYRLKTGYKGKDKQMTVSQQYLEESIRLFEQMGLHIAEQLYDKFD